jgi:Uma2 family endonuclease
MIPKPLVCADFKANPDRRMNEAEFVKWSDSKTWAEWNDGCVTVNSSVNINHAVTFGTLLCVLAGFVGAKNAGIILTRPMQVRLDRRNRVSPGAFFIGRSRRKTIRTHHIEGAPDVIFEIVLPESPGRFWREKYFLYERAGVREYWIADPASKVVEAYTLNRQKRYQRLSEKDGKVASKVLKGFYLKAAWLFAEKRPKTLVILRELGVK